MFFKYSFSFLWQHLGLLAPCKDYPCTYSINLDSPKGYIFGITYCNTHYSNIDEPISDKSYELMIIFCSSVQNDVKSRKDNKTLIKNLSSNIPCN